MAIVSWQFGLFVAAALAIYYLLPHRRQNAWLLLVSYVFYAWLAWQFVAVLVALTVVNAFAATRMLRRPAGRKAWLWAGIAANVLTLILLKYFDFFAPTVQAALSLMRINAAPDVLNILLPVGLSFTVLQTISFLVDVYRGQIEPLPHFLDFALYLAYFPKLTAGPIEQAGTFISRLTTPRRVDNEALARSFTLIVIGLFRKIVIADQLASLILPAVFLRPLAATKTGLDSAIYLVAYGFSLFNDFAGYTSIVRGVSGLFGIELSPNFLTPYFSRNFTEFWNQWHISLSHWLRNYIYFPLTRAFLRRNANPRFVLTLVIPPLITMIVSGLWHGLSLNLLMWGVLHGIYLAVERVIAALRPARRPDQLPVARQVAGGLLVFVLANLAWIPFRIVEPIRVWNFVVSLARPGWPKASLPLLSFVAISLVLDVVQYRAHDEAIFMRWSRAAQVAALTTACLLILVMSAENLPTFVYQLF